MKGGVGNCVGRGGYSRGTSDILQREGLGNVEGGVGTLLKLGWICNKDDKSLTVRADPLVQCTGREKHLNA